MRPSQVVSTQSRGARQETTCHLNSVQRSMTHPSHGLSHKRLNSFQRRTIWRMSHEAAINNIIDV
jgi:hypothetical protein